MQKARCFVFKLNQRRSAMIITNSELKERTIEKQIRRLRNGKKKARRDAALILGSIGDKWPTHHLRDALKDEDSKVRRNSAWALGEIGDRRSEYSLINALADPEAQVKVYAVGALGKLLTEDAMDYIIELLDNDEREEVQIAALRVLSEYDDEGATMAIINALELEGLESLIEDILLNCKLRKKIDLLIDELQLSEDAKVRRKIATILGKLQVKKAVRPLIQALGDEDVYVRLESVNALEKYQDERAISGLAGRLNDDISDVRRAARKALTIIAKAEDSGTELTPN
jgi:HEAT repeat protein